MIKIKEIRNKGTRTSKNFFDRISNTIDHCINYTIAFLLNDNQDKITKVYNNKERFELIL